MYLMIVESMKYANMLNVIKISIYTLLVLNDV